MEAIKQLGIYKKLGLKKNDIVLEIGSGANPFFRSDILLDKFPIKNERHRSNLLPVKIKGQPFIVADAHNLPFIDDAVDAIIARHIIEHLPSPLKFVNELKRIGKKGYISSPSPFTELVHGGYNNIDNSIPEELKNDLHHGTGTQGHEWFVLKKDKRLVFSAKNTENYILYLLFGYFIKNNTNYKQKKFFAKNKDFIETEIFWSRDNFEIEIINDIKKGNCENEKIDLEKLISQLNMNFHAPQKRYSSTDLLRSAYQIAKAKFDFFELLGCPICKKKLNASNKTIICNQCGFFPIIKGIPILLPEAVNQNFE